MTARANLALIAAMAENLAPYRDDEDAYLDTLDGETDVLDLIDGEIDAMQSDEALVAAIRSRVADMKARCERIEMRVAARRRNLALLLGHAALKKVERPLATVSLRPGSVSVRIVNEADIPTQLMRETVTRAPDKTAIKAQLEAGEHVPGVELARGDDTVSVRVR